MEYFWNSVLHIPNVLRQLLKRWKAIICTHLRICHDDSRFHCQRLMSIFCSHFVHWGLSRLVAVINRCFVQVGTIPFFRFSILGFLKFSNLMEHGLIYLISLPSTLQWLVTDIKYGILQSKCEKKSLPSRATTIKRNRNVYLLSFALLLYPPFAIVRVHPANI